ncbi:3-ketoacyl-ACP reductase [Desulfonema ishimotonii]|uniref:3-ketoacyl-ACP reductase n=1 Tax=Desulfonema ishimotonii TaxID=45657 RepID=A0A401FU29_9BACT|nr:SDR family oxidoreductase [Desulfonema ishimotonii]GBC60476.1 3-ketoacyl-ACP reductase [Desulfonema ishimotonii]
MTKTLAGKVAIVTGASRGIGRAIAEQLGADGASVVVNYAKSEKKALEAVSAIESSGSKSVAVRGDVSRTEEIQRLFRVAGERFGPVDILVNNAGIATERTIPVSDITDEQFDRLFAVNVRGTFMALREASRHMANGGRIINLSSTVVPMGLPGYSVYAGTKAAVDIFTRILSKELEGRNITVNAVAPGPVDTDLFNQGKTAEIRQRMADMCPLKRLGTPEDIARVVAFLVSDGGGWVNGQIIRANGGMV